MLDQSEWIYGYKFEALERMDTIYCPTHATDYIEKAFKYCRKDSPRTLITHNSDYSVSMAMPKDIPMPPNLIWYSTNVDIYHPQIKAIPIGLENPHWHPSKTLDLQKAIEEPPRDKILYFNLMANPNTNPNHRNKVIDNFSNNFQNNGCVVKTINGQNYSTYLNIMKSSDFTICPAGNGIDTHRVWESLYLGVWPLVEYNIHNVLLSKEGLPISPVSLETLDFDAFLDIFYMTEQHLEQYQNPETLKMSYWIDKIRNRK